MLLFVLVVLLRHMKKYLNTFKSVVVKNAKMSANNRKKLNDN